jgi:hypothetical protein
MFKRFLVFCLLAWLSVAENYPNLTLPWGTWQATKYDREGDVSAYVCPTSASSLLIFDVVLYLSERTLRTCTSRSSSVWSAILP